MNELNLVSDAKLIAQAFIQTGMDLSSDILNKYKTFFNLNPLHLKMTHKAKRLKAEYDFSLVHNEMLKTKAQLFKNVCLELDKAYISSEHFKELQEAFETSYDAQATFIKGLEAQLPQKKKAA